MDGRGTHEFLSPGEGVLAGLLLGKGMPVFFDSVAPDRLTMQCTHRQHILDLVGFSLKKKRTKS